MVPAAAHCPSSPEDPAMPEDIIDRIEPDQHCNREIGGPENQRRANDDRGDHQPYDESVCRLSCRLRRRSSQAQTLWLLPREPSASRLRSPVLRALLRPHQGESHRNARHEKESRRSQNNNEREVIAANRTSRGLSHLSTTRYVRGLNFWVRNESRCFPSAMAAITRHPETGWKPRPGFEPGCS